MEVTVIANLTLYPTALPQVRTECRGQTLCQVLGTQQYLDVGALPSWRTQCPSETDNNI